MTITERTIADMLEDRRGDAYATEAAKALGVSRNMYTQWESGHAIPGDEYVPALARWLEVDEEWMALKRYHEKLARAKGVYLSSMIVAA